MTEASRYKKDVLESYFLITHQQRDKMFKLVQQLNHQFNKGRNVKMTEASKQQVGGTHYKLLSPQPAEFCYENGLNNLQSEAISYILRCRHKDGGKNALTDLDKAIHTLQMWKEFFDFGHEPVPEITFPSNVYQDHEHLFQEQVSAVAVIANISYTEPFL